MKWYQKVLKEHKREVIISAAISLAVTLAFSLWYYTSGKPFTWVEISPIEAPTLSIRLLSALVFVSFGEILYALKFYYVLYMIFVVFLRDKALYNDLKKIIWRVMMFVMGFVVVPWIIDLLNKIVSFFYNVGILLLYISPPIVIFAAIFLPGYYFLKKKKALPPYEEKTETTKN